MDCLIVIPARMDSTRFPGKPLADLCGKPMIQWVYEASVASGVGSQVLVATPDQAILDTCLRFGAEAVLTRSDHPSGTDRIAEVAQKHAADIYINVQGDEPLMPKETIQACAQALKDHPECQVSSVYCECKPDEEENPAVVKVVTDMNGVALYFSRYPIPFPRNLRASSLKKHVGIYGFRKEALEGFSHWPQGMLEKAESLEQLRFLENGVRIAMAEAPMSELAVDTPQQAEEVRAILMARMHHG